MSAVRDYALRRRGTVPYEIDLDGKVMFLGSSEACTEEPIRVERIETHFSWVFLTDRHVYKLKKPGRGEGFDFTSPERRRRNAEEEVRLNRRLARDVYVGVMSLTFDGCRGLAIGGRGKTADWLVRMIRLAGANPGPPARLRKLSARRSPRARRPPGAIFPPPRACTDDCRSPALIAFCKALGVMIRARIAILHLQDFARAN